MAVREVKEEALLLVSRVSAAHHTAGFAEVLRKCNREVFCLSSYTSGLHLKQDCVI